MTLACGTAEPFSQKSHQSTPQGELFQSRPFYPKSLPPRVHGGRGALRGSWGAEGLLWRKGSWSSPCLPPPPRGAPFRPLPWRPAEPRPRFGAGPPEGRPDPPQSWLPRAVAHFKPGSEASVLEGPLGCPPRGRDLDWRKKCRPMQRQNQGALCKSGSLERQTSQTRVPGTPVPKMDSYV